MNPVSSARMFSFGHRVLLLVAVCAFTPSGARAQDTEAAVRRARTAFNDAIARRDLDAMSAVLAPSYHLLAGRSSQSHGIQATRTRWETSFGSDSLYNCVRTAERVQLNARWLLAQESGRWRCVYTAAAGDAKAGEATGVYDAKWQRDTRGVWRLHAEVFTTLRCVGRSASCALPDTIGASAAPSGLAVVPGASASQAVKAARRWYNGAIARGDADGIQRLFVPGYHAIYGRSSQHIEGDSAARADWREEFRENGVGSCVRTPTAVEVNAAWGLAHERGTWRCRVTTNGVVARHHGSYVAKWQRDTSGRWRVQAEVFTSLGCSGAGACVAPAPLEAQ